MNLHDPKTRKRVLLGGAGFGLVVAFLWSRHAASSKPGSAIVGATTDPTAGASYFPTSGMPAALGASPGAAVTIPQDNPPVDVAAAVTSGIADAFGAIDWASIFHPDAPPDPPVNNPPVPPAPPPAAPPSAPTAKGIWWGGKFLTSIDQLAAYERAHGNKGFDPNVWAARHPDAARSLNVIPPSPVPAAKASPSAPVPVAPVSGVAVSTPPPAAPLPVIVRRKPGKAVAV